MASTAPTGPDHARRRASGGGLLTPAFLDELRTRTTLSTLVGRTVKLHKAGREYKGCCPFHQEKTPSFYVNDEKAFYHCFGCGAHGDAIRFLTEARGLPFMDAVKELAGAAGLDLPAPDPAARARAERAGGLVGVMERAAEWYRGRLAADEGAAARAYLGRRRLTEATCRTFGIGFAPDGRHRLAPALPDAKPDELIEAGLLIRPEDRPGTTPYDRFRGRLMIPIRDARGRTIAFGGRVIGDGEPKYLNSPETPLFDKGRTLFNLDRAGPVARKSGRAIVVEGYLDVIALDQAGIGDAVAPLGTALTEAQMERLWSLVDAPVLCFDGDAAGRKAGLRAATRALAVLRPGKTLCFAMLPAGKDPDDLVREGGAQAFEAAVADRVPLDRLIYLAERDAADTARPEGRAGLRQRLNELAASCADRLVADEYRRAFTSLFFEDFGWKQAERRTIASAFLRTEAGADGPGLSRRYLKAMLWGFSRRPELIRERLEDLDHLTIADPDLARWRDTLVDAVVDRRALDGDAMLSILEVGQFPDLVRSRLEKDLLFPFVQADVGSERAAEQILGLLDTLSVERELDERLRSLNAELAALMAGDDAAGYARIADERADLAEQRNELLEAAYRLGARDED